MPVVYRCRGCGRVLYYERRRGICSPMDVVALYQRCPGCGRRLGESIEVRVARVGAV